MLKKIKIGFFDQFWTKVPLRKLNSKGAMCEKL